MNINQENTIIEIHDLISTFNCDGIECKECPFYLNDNEHNCLGLKMSKTYADIMVRRGAWKRDSNGHLIID